ncbi:C2-domain-containing protein [Schizopora paradoxa]|uniref:C2-domain-containing protein n=1 Tax=Schizopora paradoxa TaxID=27342 RepID=A0A0H2S6L0_9AGAM|nr:C2-domain-containing protein [Schizopora paradoxa]
MRVKTKALATEVPEDQQLIDVSIQFIGASGLPKMDLVGSCDPYFVAKIDDAISFVSTVQPNTLCPVWNEVWNVKNVPENANMKVEVMDKDEGSLLDDYVGAFETDLSPGAKEVQIISSMLKRVRGTFWMKITTSPSSDPNLHRYTFDGPIRYSRHFSPTVGRLTNLNDERLYSTWKLHIKGVPLFFRDEMQHWNTAYPAAQSIFAQRPSGLAIRSSIVAAHRLLYARSTRNGFGVIATKEDVLNLLRSVPGRVTPSPGLSTAASSCTLASNTVASHRVKPAVYTYVITNGDDTLRFSETGAAFFVDFASKHALHANCAESVRYSGEFHPRPAVPGGWAGFSDDTPDDKVQWEIVVDNNSGTYAPDAMLLPELKALLEYNFPGLTFIALDRKDPELERSREACRAYAVKHRGVRQTELQPHAKEGEETLQNHVVNHNDVEAERPEELPPAENEEGTAPAIVPP